jgi:drug/metabolite transporter (DMT)-like permease
MALAVSLVLAGDANVSPQGMLLAVTSGALASGLGYVVWYAALRGLTASGAAITQISVAPIATLGGILFLGEMLTSRIMVASILILGGIALALLSRSSAR